MHQVHGAEVPSSTAATAAGDRRRATRWSPTAPGVVLMVRVADCVPVLLADPAAGVVGAAHAGRPGLAAGVVAGRASSDARRSGADRHHAPGSGRTCAARCYEVPEEMRGGGRRASCRPRVRRPRRGARRRSTSAPACAPSSSAPASRRRRVAAARCEYADLYSYRRDGAGAGRLAGLVRLRMTVSDAAGRRDRAPGSTRSASGSPAPAPTPAATRDDVTLVVVTKFFPASDVRLLADLGVTDVGENRHQEAEAKAAECADLGLTWHFIGGLQSNKAAAVAAYADVVESVDRRQAASAALAAGAHERGAPVDVPASRSASTRPGAEGRVGRATPPTLPALAAAVDEAEGLRLRGLMAVAPLGEDPATAFARLAGVRRDVRRAAPRRDLALGRDERRPRGRPSGPARHTCGRLRGPRSEALGQVMSRPADERARQGAHGVPEDSSHERRDAQDR